MIINKPVNENFKPKCNASQMPKCDASEMQKLSDQEKLNLIRKDKKFKDVLKNINKNNNYYKESYLSEKEKETLKELIKKMFKENKKNNLLTFDDQKIKNKFYRETEKTRAEKNTPEDKAIDRFIRRQRGIIGEDYIIEKINKDEKYKFKKIQKKVIKENDYIIVGKADGFDFEKNTLIEIKTKTRKMNIYFTDKEKKQVLSYMKMYKAKLCFFVIVYPDTYKIVKKKWDEKEYNAKIDTVLKEFRNEARNYTIKDVEELYLNAKKSISIVNSINSK